MFNLEDYWHVYPKITLKEEHKDMTEKEIKEIALKAVREALEKEAGGKDCAWQPERNETYYTVDGGEASACANCSQDTTDKAIAVGQCFKTRKEAEDYIEWLRAFKTLRDDTKGHKFDEVEDNFFVECDTDGELRVESDDGCISQLFYFESAELARKSIEKHEKEWKIFYGVKED